MDKQQLKINRKEFTENLEEVEKSVRVLSELYSNSLNENDNYFQRIDKFKELLKSVIRGSEYSQITKLLARSIRSNNPSKELRPVECYRSEKPVELRTAFLYTALTKMPFDENSRIFTNLYFQDLDEYRDEFKNNLSELSSVLNVKERKELFQIITGNKKGLDPLPITNRTWFELILLELDPNYNINIIKNQLYCMSDLQKYYQLKNIPDDNIDMVLYFLRTSTNMADDVYMLNKTVVELLNLLFMAKNSNFYHEEYIIMSSILEYFNLREFYSMGSKEIFNDPEVIDKFNKLTTAYIENIEMNLKKPAIKNRIEKIMKAKFHSNDNLKFADVFNKSLINYRSSNGNNYIEKLVVDFELSK